jgi:hypothetical protein
MYLSGHYITPERAVHCMLELKVSEAERTKMEAIDQKNTGFCEIRIKGRLEPRWAEWFDLMSFSSEENVTVLTGTVPDQAALQGLMQKISMLGMTIVSLHFQNEM